MSSLRVFVIDDVPETAQHWAERIRSTFGDGEVRGVAGIEFVNEVKELSRRRRLARESKEPSSYDLQIDEASVVMIDYDLLHLEELGDATGAELTYLLRCYSRCTLLIVLNEFGENTFDLEMRGHPELFADFHLGGDQVHNPGLWSEPFRGHRPWHWPLVPQAVDRLKLCVQDLTENFDRPVLEYLGLDRFVHLLPESARIFLATQRKDARQPGIGATSIEEVTFEQFASSSRGGIRPKDAFADLESKHRFAAARISMWLNTIVLPAQSVLIDAPHLAMRFPSLLRSGESLESWNEICSVDEAVPSKMNDHLKDYEFPKPHWLWRPAWIWPAISEDERIAEVRDPWEKREYDWVFCEDLSKFVPSQLARPFTADLESPFVRKFVVDAYAPGVENHVAELGTSGPSDPRSVSYEPGFRLSL